MRICAEHDNTSNKNKISTALQCLTILLSYTQNNIRQYYYQTLLLRICNIIAKSDNIIILIYNNHAKF